MEKLDGKSMDIVNENIVKLKELFPDVFSEGTIDFEALEATLGEYVDSKEERYSFNWNGKAKARRIAQTPSTGTLRPAKEESKNWDSTENLYIEGDNLEVLKLLQKSYHKQVKMIYIDPPYNTGKDFVYKDNFKDNIKNYLEQTGQVDSEGNKLSTNSDTSGRYHSDWLNMMYPRLKLARNLLKDDGIVFISIDDNEVSNLRKLCDEIFGEDNFIAQATVMNNPKGRALDKYMGTCHEYLLVYSRMMLPKGALSIPKTEEEIQKDYPRHDKGGKYRELELRNTHREFGKHNRPNLFYHFYVSSDGTVSLDSSNNTMDVLPLWDDGYEGCWTWGKDKAKRELSLITAKKVSNNWKIYRKSYANIDGEVSKKQLKTILADKKYHTEKGQAIFNELFKTKAKIFQSPKSIDLIKDTLKMSQTENNDICLDFFSGSSSMAHAVMQLNSEDNRNRKYICVQLPEKTDKKSEAYKAGYKTISEIGKERIRRAGEKIISDNPDKDLSALDISFKVFKLDSSNIKAWDPESENLEQSLFEAVNNIKSDRTEEDILYEILLKYGLDLTLPIEQLELAGKEVYVVGLGALVICLDEQITLDTVEEIAKLKEQYESDDLMRVVFRDNGFKDAEVKTNAIQILKQSGIDDVKSL